MTRKMTAFFAAVLAGLATATTVLAEETTSPASPPSTGMMGQHDGKMGMMGQMNPGAMNEMMQMAANCNRMMESMNNTPKEPGKEQAPAPHN